MVCGLSLWRSFYVEIIYVILNKLIIFADPGEKCGLIVKYLPRMIKGIGSISSIALKKKEKNIL